MIYNIKFLPEAKIDLSQAKEYYLIQGHQKLAEDFKQEINRELDYIQKSPKHYQIQYRKLRRALVKRFPYAIFYRIEEQKIIVFAVLHTKQDLGKLRSRLK